MAIACPSTSRKESRRCPAPAASEQYSRKNRPRRSLCRSEEPRRPFHPDASTRKAVSRFRSISPVRGQKVRMLTCPSSSVLRRARRRSYLLLPGSESWNSVHPPGSRQPRGCAPTFHHDGTATPSLRPESRGKGCLRGDPKEEDRLTEISQVPKQGNRVHTGPRTGGWMVLEVSIPRAT